MVLEPGRAESEVPTASCPGVWLAVDVSCGRLCRGDLAQAGGGVQVAGAGPAPTSQEPLGGAWGPQNTLQLLPPGAGHFRFLRPHRQPGLQVSSPGLPVGGCWISARSLERGVRIQSRDLEAGLRGCDKAWAWAGARRGGPRKLEAGKGLDADPASRRAALDPQMSLGWPE